MNTRLLQTLITSYAQNAKDSVLSPSTGKQIKLYYAKLTNRSGGTIDVGILKKLATTGSYALFGSAAGVGSDLTTAINAGTASTILTTTTNDLFVVQCREKFSLIGLTVSQAQAGSPVYIYQYWNGTIWTTLTTISVPTSYTTGTQLIVFLPPSDWAVGGDGTTNLDATRYSVRCKATTAPSTAVKVTALWAGLMLDFKPNLDHESSMEYKGADPTLCLMFDGGESLLPYFGGTATANNLIHAQYMIQD